MAAASPTFPISRETTNYVRLCVLLVDVGSKVLRKTFDRIRPRGPLDTVLGTPPTSITLTSLLRRKVVNPSQWSILYPAIKSSVSSENFDITLLMVLLRNICGLTPPAAGWDALPSPTDVNREDDLARIKYYRNTVYGHAAQASVDDTKFNDYWMNIRDTLVRLGGADYQAPIDGLQYTCMDRDTEERYIEMLKQWKVDEDVIGVVLKDKINNVEGKVDNVQASVNNVEAKVDNVQVVVDRIETQLVPTLVFTSNTVTRGGNDDEEMEMIRKKPRSELPEVDCDVLGHETEIDKTVKALLGGDGNEAKAGVLVSGIPGIGKSTVALQAGHRLDKSGHIVLFCSLRDTQGKEDEEVPELVFREILSVCAPDVQQIKDNSRRDLLNWCRHLDYELILILDDADDAMENLEFFKQFLKKLRTCSKCNIKFIITSRRLDITRVTTGLNIEVVEVKPLNLEESVAVLKNGANLTSDSEQFILEKLPRIAEFCQNIPLVLRLAGPLLAPEADYTLDELIQKLQGNPTETLGLDDRIMSIAFKRLDEPLKHALVGLSVFPRSFERYAAEALLGEKCTERLSKLKQRCLIQQYCLPQKRPIDGSSSNYPLHKTDKNDSKRYVIHLLIRDYARQMGELELKPIVRHCQQRFLEHFLSLILGYSELYWRRDSCKASLILFNEERVSLESTLADVGQEKVRYCKELKDVVEACGQVASYIGDCVPSKLYYDFLNGLLQFSESQKNVTKQVAILCLLFDESRRHGGLLEKSKRLMIIDQAIKLYKDNPSSFQQDSVSEIFYLSHYGRYLSQDLRKRDEAQPLLRKAVSMFEEENQRNCASTFDMGRVLSQMGHNERMDKEKDEIRHKEALTCYKEALSFRQTHYGEHIVTALAHKDLADYYLYVNDFGEAEENYEAAERIFEDLEMMKQKEAVPTYKNLGRCYERNDKIEKAREKFEMGCDIANTTIEGNHKWKVEINTYLALLLYKLDEFTKANELSENVFHMAEELEMEMWHDKEELETFYKRDRHQVTTV